MLACILAILLLSITGLFSSQYPPGYEEKMAEKEAAKEKKRKRDSDESEDDENGMQTLL